MLEGNWFWPDVWLKFREDLTDGLVDWDEEVKWGVVDEYPELIRAYDDDQIDLVSKWVSLKLDKVEMTMT